MPNWVFNTVSKYDNELYNKYKGEEGQEIDFNKIIPEPEEIANTISGSINKEARLIKKYNKFMDSVKDKENVSKYSNPLYSDLKKDADRKAEVIGYSAIENPDKSLNEIRKEDTHVDGTYNDYTNLYGNKDFHKLNNKEFINSCDKYRNKVNDKFLNQYVNNKSEIGLIGFKNIEEYADHIDNLKEKYGTDNWYDWRNANWGTKWNAGETYYDPEMEQMQFDTAWSIPQPIFAKIAEDNPNKELDIYSEEETGWFVESETKDGKYYETASGEILYDEETDGRTETRQEYNPPVLISKEELKERYGYISQAINNFI